MKRLKDFIRNTHLYGKLGPYLLHARGKLFDLKHGVRTCDGIRAVELRTYEIASSSAAFGNGYIGVDPKLFRRIFSNLDINYEKMQFIDFGSGKGRALLLASELPFRKIVGIELVPELHRIAEQNINRFKSSSQKCKDIELVCVDAIHYPIPPVPAVFFIFNSFKEEVLAPVVTNIRRSLEEHPRDNLIVYFNPELEDILERDWILKKIASSRWYTIYSYIGSSLPPHAEESVV